MMIPFLCPKQRPHVRNVETMMPITGQSKQEEATKALQSSIDVQHVNTLGVGTEY